MSRSDEWLSRFEPIDASDLTSTGAKRLVDYIDHYGEGVVHLLDLRQLENVDLVVFELNTGVPQAPIYPLLPSEKLAVTFARMDGSYLVHALRDSFPDTPHQALPFRGWPTMLCIDDRPWIDAQATWTPGELILRLLAWFERAAMGRSYDPRQPIEPNMIGSAVDVLVPASALGPNPPAYLVGELNEEGTFVRIRPFQEGDDVTKAPPWTVVTYRMEPERVQRMRFVPQTLAELDEMCAARGLDLVNHLIARGRQWMSADQRWSLSGRLMIVLDMPIVNLDGTTTGARDLRAFVSDVDLRQVLVALGIAEHAPSDLGEESNRLVPVLKPDPPVPEALETVGVVVADVHQEFGLERAAELSDTEVFAVPTVLVGCGAVGSHLAENLFREGRIRPTLVDEDRILPHNLARHTASMANVGGAKAGVLAERLRSLALSEHDAIIPITVPLRGSDVNEDALNSALTEAELIIDASASTSALRTLSDHPTRARRASIFLNPRGTAAVVLLEDTDRRVTLRDAEAVYFSALLNDELRDHLAPPVSPLAYSGSCRAVTSRIPQSRVAALTGLASVALSRMLSSADADGSVITLADDDAVRTVRLKPTAPSAVTYDGWTIAVASSCMAAVTALRNAGLPNETGGCLLGMFDLAARRIEVVAATGAPDGSRGTVTGFMRGRQGLREHLQLIEQRTAAQVRYLGEWHSHPSGVGSAPSATDRIQLSWLSELADIEGVPKLMLIAGDRGASIAPAVPRKNAA